MLDIEQYHEAGRGRERNRRRDRTAAPTLAIGGSTAREIAASAEAAIRDGTLDTGDALPTVRALAAVLGTSPATVSSAYRILRQRGLVIAEGRRGTRVAPRPALRVPARPGSGPSPSDSHLRDLAVGLPDPVLLPPLEPALERIDLERTVQFGGLERPHLELVDAGRRWFGADGLSADALTVVSGAFDGVERVLQAHLRPGDRVIVEDPAYVSTRDLLFALGLVVVPVPVDEAGFVPERLEAALSKGAEAVVIVPRAQNPLGAAMDPPRMQTLQRLLEPHPDLLLIEDDHASIVSGAPFSTLVTPSTRRWAVIRSMSKILHPDVRLALVAGDETTIARVEGRQALGPRWVSHVLQALVAELLRYPEFEHTAARAQDVYASRRETLISALVEHGLRAHGRSGLNVWVPVREEAPVIRALLDAGWLVLAGERFRIRTPPGVRITITTLQEDEAEEIARTIAAVEHAGRPRRSY